MAALRRGNDDGRRGGRRRRCLLRRRRRRLEARIGGYEAHEANEEAIERFYGATAELIGARPREIAFCSSATRAWDMAFYAFRFERGDRLLTSVADYVSNYIAYLQVAERDG